MAASELELIGEIKITSERPEDTRPLIEIHRETVISYFLAEFGDADPIEHGDFPAWAEFVHV